MKKQWKTKLLMFISEGLVKRDWRAGRSSDKAHFKRMTRETP